MEEDWLFSSENYICDIRTAGVLVRDGKILVQRETHGNEYALPGGHIKIGETLEDGLIREYEEETGASACCGVRNAFGSGTGDRHTIYLSTI